MNKRDQALTNRLQARMVSIVIICAMIWLAYSWQGASSVHSSVTDLGSNRPEHIVLTWQGDARTSISLTWRTSPHIRDTVVEVVRSDQYAGFPDEKATRTTGGSFLFTTDIGTMAVHEAELTGLTPGTTYTYRVGDGREGHWSETHEFTTEPSAEQPFTFLFTSDTQAYPNRSEKNGYGIWADMFRRGLTAFPDASFMLLSGDIVDYGDQQQQWELWFDAAAEMLPDMPIVPTVGNHDAVRSGEANFRAQFQLPKNGPESELELVYSFDYGNMHMAVLNTEGDLAVQAAWLLDDMSASDKLWKIVAFHRSPYHGHASRANTDVREAWTSVFDAAKVDLVLSGHDHTYMRSWPLREGKRTEDGEGTVYVIGGTAGSKFYSSGDYPWMRVTFDEDVQIVSGVTIDGDRLRMHVLTRDGRVADAFTMVKGGETAPDFLDLPATHWAYETIMSMKKEGIVSGINETRFAPDQTISRAEFAALLVRSLGLPPIGGGSRFLDVAADDWFAEEVNIVNHHGIVLGIDGQRFAPYKQLTREEMAVMTVRAYEYKTGGSSVDEDLTSSYIDRSELADWSLDSVNKASSYGLMRGLPDGRFAPGRWTNRAEAAQVIMRLMELTAV